MTAADANCRCRTRCSSRQTIFTLTQNIPYNFGVVTQLLNEVYDIQTFNTSSVRNIYSPDVRTATELVIDRVADEMGKDRMAFRREFARDDRMRAVIDTVARVAAGASRCRRAWRRASPSTRNTRGAWPASWSSTPGPRRSPARSRGRTPGRG